MRLLHYTVLFTTCKQLGNKMVYLNKSNRKTVKNLPNLMIFFMPDMIIIIIIIFKWKRIKFMISHEYDWFHDFSWNSFAQKSVLRVTSSVGFAHEFTDKKSLRKVEIWILKKMSIRIWANWSCRLKRTWSRRPGSTSGSKK